MCSLWAPLPAASSYWYLRDCPHQKRWKKKIAQRFCLLKLQKGTCYKTFYAVFCFTGFLTREKSKPSLWLPGRHYVLTAWSVAFVAMYDQLMAFWTSVLATQSVVQGPAEPLGSLTERQVHKPHPKPTGLESLWLKPRNLCLTSSSGDFHSATFLEALVFWELCRMDWFAPQGRPLILWRVLSLLI